ncbi:hypothetical protein PIB30_029943 [Stylosanthes scabra]|uniref:Uncharacterized protein n=1 Tax=Stylosanthes scabra TaxID=79078 RepID=A0ABU6V9H4_9FABA|nr:hypothetical protein [Stylosanthes scabra]
MKPILISEGPHRNEAIIKNKKGRSQACSLVVEALLPRSCTLMEWDQFPTQELQGKMNGVLGGPHFAVVEFNADTAQPPVHQHFVRASLLQPPVTVILPHPSRSPFFLALRVRRSSSRVVPCPSCASFLLADLVFVVADLVFKRYLASFTFVVLAVFFSLLV